MIIGKIEIASKEYWKWMFYDDGILYCSMMVIDDKMDWRMIRDVEEMRYIRDNYIVDYVKELSNSYMLSLECNIDWGRGAKWGWVIPVRDV